MYSCTYLSHFLYFLWLRLANSSFFVNFHWFQSFRGFGGLGGWGKGSTLSVDARTCILVDSL